MSNINSPQAIAENLSKQLIKECWRKLPFGSGKSFLDPDLSRKKFARPRGDVE